MAPGRWPVVFLLERAEQAGSCRCQEKHGRCQPGSTVQSKTSDQFVITVVLMIKKKMCFVSLQLRLCVYRYSMNILRTSSFL